MKLVTLASYILLTHLKVDASTRKPPVARFERPTKSGTRGSRSRGVLTTTSSPRDVELHPSTAPVTTVDSSSSISHPSDPPASLKRKEVVLSSDAFVTPTRPAVGIVSPSAPRRVPVAGGGGGSTSEAELPSRRHKGSTIRSLSFDASVETTGHDDARRALFGGKHSAESDDDDVAVAYSSKPSKRSRVSSTRRSGSTE